MTTQPHAVDPAAGHPMTDEQLVEKVARALARCVSEDERWQAYDTMAAEALAAVGLPGRLLHDIEEPDDLSPTCCVEGCDCGGES